MVDRLETQLTAAELQVRIEALAKARQFIDRAATAGGISAPVRKTFPSIRQQTTDIRIDIEVITGIAFV